jgi:hypothetical protein
MTSLRKIFGPEDAAELARRAKQFEAHAVQFADLPLRAVNVDQMYTAEDGDMVTLRDFADQISRRSPTCRCVPHPRPQRLLHGDGRHLGHRRGEDALLRTPPAPLADRADPRRGVLMVPGADHGGDRRLERDRLGIKSP